MTKERMEEIIKAYGCEATYVMGRKVVVVRDQETYGVYCELGTFQDLLEMNEEELESNVRDASNSLGHLIVTTTRLRIKVEVLHEHERD